ncbi:response regulator transcription factor [Butyrivibrio sp. WCD3002]|uniref:response regulator transcription factor n=1 Tax=Butyrivibrio sp. WCD3002 TaxID=1280676 RepID=UPI00042313A9|nr:helix-turn-helix domain-containing protein [Butyrivibrio sp. WCD3002]
MKILISDDEYYIVQLVNSKLDWSLLGVDKVLMSYNGADAIDIFDAEKPELVLCDIDMPRYNGMDVLDHVMEKAPDTKFIFLTCFQKFDYVKKAINKGAFDYILKPFSEPEIYACLMKAVNEIRDKEKIEESKKQLQELFLRNLVIRNIGPSRSEIENALERSINIGYSPDKRYRMVLSYISQKGSVPKDQSVYQFVFYNMQSEIFSGNAEKIDGMDLLSDGYYGVLRVCDEDTELVDIMAEAQTLSGIVEEHLDTEFSCCISEPVYMWEMADTLDELKSHITRQFLNSIKVGLLRDSVDDNKNQTCIIDREKIEKYLDERNADLVVEYIRELLDELQQRTMLTGSIIREMHADFMQIVLEYCSKKHITAHEVLRSEELLAFQKKMDQMPFYLIRYVQLLCTNIIEIMENQDNESVIVARISQYVEEHFREQIGRDEIAEQLHYSKNYLSRIFSSRLGISVREYINGYRIEEAKRILLTTDVPVGDIALDVGFDSMTYFSTIFKKVTGETPSQYRSKKR